ncbi:MAG: hypothetical protein QM504_06835 [Pseudomonadota bacterium]
MKNVNKLFEKMYPEMKYMDCLQFKAVKKFNGRGGQPLLKGNLYLGSKLIAEVSEDFCGGCLNIRAVENDSLKKVVNFVGKGDGEEYRYYLSCVLEMFSMLVDARKYKKTKTYILNLKTDELSAYRLPISDVRISNIIASELKDGDVVLSSYI